VNTKIQRGWKDGAPSMVPRKITTELIEGALKKSAMDAERIQMLLVAEAWIEPDRLVPTRKGMALAAQRRAQFVRNLKNRTEPSGRLSAGPVGKRRTPPQTRVKTTA
jgi:hypothetical protein